jgi:gp16 family phage-associated protein
MKTTEVIKRLPYPQTVQSARTYIVAHGLSVSQLARDNNLPRLVVQDLLRPNGQLKGMRGQAHLAAIVLGLKPAPDTPAANDPTKLPRRKNEAQARRAAA